ncbi:MAG: hypothetical protein ACT4O3_05890 [Elusimicrobiota bacterium]
MLDKKIPLFMRGLVEGLDVPMAFPDELVRKPARGLKKAPLDLS